MENQRIPFMVSFPNYRSLLATTVISICGLVSVSGQSAYAQIVPDQSTATEVSGNRIAPVGAGTVSGGNLYHSFDQFNVPNSGVVFGTGNSTVDGGKINNILNRVTGDNPSQILGTIESRNAFPNANLYLINPNGVVFGRNARLDIGGSFHVNTGTSMGFAGDRSFSADKSKLDFPSGDPQNIKFAVSQPAAIINQGNLAVDAGKNISFTAGSVINSGILNAPNGNIAITSVTGGSVVDLRSPDLVLGLSVLKNAVPTNWNGSIGTLPKLAELLTGKVEQGDRVVVKPDGTLAIVTTPTNDQLPITNGTTVISGTINTSSVNADGGKIGIFGDRVALINSLISTTGVNGGAVLIGGDFQGNGVVPNAQFTYFDHKSVVDVSGLGIGNGGLGIVWSDVTTQFLGTILSKGGTLSGNGGFVEVSGKENLLYRGTVDTSAIKGNIGTLLLDPNDITLVPSGGSFTTLTDVSNSSNPDIAPNTLGVDLINNATSNVILSATNNININQTVNISTSGIGFTAQAGNNINLNANINSNGGTINLTAGKDISGIGAISSTTTTGNAGAITLNAGGAVNVSTIDASASLGNGGNINFQAVGNITTNNIVTSRTFNNNGNGGNISFISTSGTINTSLGDVDSRTQNANAGKSGTITYQATGDIITGNVFSFAPSGTGNAGSISLNTSAGIIDTSLGEVFSYSAGGRGGDINFQSAGNILTKQVLAYSNNPSIFGAQILLKSTGGSIQATDTISNSSILGDGTNKIQLEAKANITVTNISSDVTNGIGGLISLNTTNGDITTSSLSSRSVNGTSGDISLIATNGSVNTLRSGIDSISVNGNGGNITIAASNGNINTSFLFANTTSPNPSSRAGDISLIANNLLINNDIKLSAASGKGGNLSLSGNIPLLKNVLFSTNGIAGSGNIDLSNANITGSQTLILDAGNGNISFGAIGTSAVPLTAINLVSGGITLNKDIYVTDALRFDSPVTLGGNIAITNSAALTFGNTVNGNQALSISALNILFNGIVGGVTPLAKLTTNTTSTISSTVDIDIRTVGDISTGQISNFRRNISLITGGNISTSSITTLAPNGTDNGGNVSLISGGSINNTGGILSYSAGGTGGNILYQATGNINIAGNVEAHGSLNGKGGDISFITSGGSIVANSIIQSGGIDSGNIALQALGNISVFQIDATSSGKSGNISILTSSGAIAAAAPLATYGGNITLQAQGNIKTSGVLSYGLTNINGGEISLTSLGGSIDTSLGGVNSSSPSGNGNNIFINAPLGSILASDIGAYTFSTNPSSTAGNISLNALNIAISGNNSSAATAGKAGNFTLSGNIALNATTRLYTNSSGISGNIDLSQANITGNQGLELNAGTGNISLGAIGTSSIPLTVLNLISGTTTLNKDIYTTGAMQFSSPVTLGGDIFLRSAGNITFSNTINGNQVLSINTGTNSIFLNGIVGEITPLASLTTNSTSTLTSTGSLDIKTLGDITTGNIRTNAKNISLTTSGTSTVGNITAGVIITTSPAGESGSVNIQATGDIKVSAISSIGSGTGNNGGNISLTTTGGLINTGDVESLSSVGSAGDIFYQATGNIQTKLLRAITLGGSGNGGNITLSTTGGSILATGVNTNGGGKSGDILLQATGDITASASTFGAAKGGGDVTFVTSGGAIAIPSIIQTSGNVLLQAKDNITTPQIGSEGNITIITSNGAINASSGTLGTTGGNITLQAEGNITTSSGAGVISYSYAPNANGGDISITSKNGSIESKLSGFSSTSDTGNAGNISISALNGNISTGGIAANILSNNTTSTAGNISLNALNLVIGGNIEQKAPAGKAGDLVLGGNIALIANTTFSNNSGGISGNIDLSNANITGDLVLTINAGTGNISLGAIGTSSVPLRALNLTSGSTTLNRDIYTTGAMQFSSPVTLGGDIFLRSAGNITFSNTINGNQLLSLNAGASSIFFNGIVGGVSPLASLAIASTLTSDNNLDVRTIGNVITANVSNLGRNITIISNNGNIDTSAGAIDASNSTGNGGDVLLQSLGNIAVNRISTSSLSGGSGGDISLISLGGSINTSAGSTIGSLGSRSNSGIGGNILLQAAGNITTAGLSTSSGQGSGKISLITSNGSIDTSLGLVQTEMGVGNGNGGEILYRATGNITTREVLSRILLPGTVGSGGKISFLTTGGSINNQGAVQSLSFGTNGNGGDILYEATGDIKTSSFGVRSEGNLNGGNITFKTTGGAIDISLGPVNSSGNNGGTAGNILFQATGNITARDLLASSVSGNGNNVTLQTTGNVAIAGNVDTSATSGNAGNIAITATGVASDINVSFLNSRSFSTNGNGGNGGNISLTTTGNIKSSSDIFSGSFNGNNTTGGNISLITTGGSIDTSAGVIDTSNNTDNGGDVLLQSLGNIAVNRIITASLSGGSGGDISLISLGGSINTSAGSIIGFLDSRSKNGIGGDILLQAAGNITTVGLSTTSGQGSGKISLITSNGSIDTSLGLVQTEIGLGSNDSEILYRATGNITTGEVLSRVFFSSTVGNGGKISFVTTGGSINTQKAVQSLSFGTNGNGGDILYEATGDIKTSSFGVRSEGNLNGGNITFKTTGGAIDTSLGPVNSSSNNGGTAGNILFQATGNITARDLLASSVSGNGNNVTLQTTGNVVIRNINTNANNGNAGNVTISATGIASDINVNSSDSRNSGINGNGGNITLQGTRNITAGNLLSSSDNGNTGNISINSLNGNISTGVITASTGSTSPTSSAGNISLNALNLAIGGSINNSANAGKAGDLTFGGNISLTADTTFSTSSGGISGNIDLSNANITGDRVDRVLTINAGTGNISLGAIGTSSVPLRALNLTSGSTTLNKDIYTINALQFNSPVTLGDNVAISSANSITFNNTVNGNHALSFVGGNGIFLNGIVGGITPLASFTVTAARGVLQSTGSIEINTLGDISTGNITNNGRNITLITKGTSSGNIAVASINTSSPTTGGNILLQATGNIIANDGIGSAGNFGDSGTISFISTGGSIDTSQVDVSSSSFSSGNSGKILYQAAGNIKANEVVADVLRGSGNAANISFITTGGSISTYLVSTVSAVSGNSGDVLYQATGNISTGGFRVSSFNSGNGNAGKISLISTEGAIDATRSMLSYAENGDGGDVLLQAKGDISISGISAFATNGTGGKISLISREGLINTNAVFSVNSINGNSGNILLNARDSITTQNLSAFATNGNGGNITIQTAGVATVATGDVSTGTNNGNAGNITITSLSGTIRTNSLYSATASVDPSSNAGLVILNTNNLEISGGIDVSAANGTGSNFDFSGNLRLLANSTISSDGLASSGNIDLSNANITGDRALTINAGTGNISLGAIGTSSVPVTPLTLISGSTTLNKDIYTTNEIQFNSPVSLGGNVTISSASNITFNNTINGNQALSLIGGNAIFLNGIVGGITPLASFTTNLGRAVVLSTGSVEINTLGDISTGNITNNGRNISLITKGTTSGNITVASINTSSPTTGGNVLLQATGNITANDGISSVANLGNSGKISFISTGGSIDTSRVSVASRSFNGGNSGEILYQAAGDIKANIVDTDVSLGIGNAANISFITTGGSISTNVVSSRSTVAGNSGDILYQATGNISTGIFRVSSFNSGNGNAGKISLISTEGAIDATRGMFSYAENGDGGDVLLQAKGDITIGNTIDSSSATNGKGANISLITSSGSINTTLGFLNSRGNDGLGGDILLQAAGDITTTDLTTSSGQGSGKISLITSNGSIDTSLGLVETQVGFGSGNGGDILYRASGNITTGQVLSRILSIPSTAIGGKISFITTGGSINTTGAVYSYSFGTNGGDILYQAAGDIKTPANGVITSGNLNGGNITFKTTGGAIDTSLGQVNSSGDNGGTAGNISFQATGNITTQDLLASTLIGSGGNITLLTQGNVVTGNIDSGANANAGNIDINTTGLASDITVGFLNSRSFGNGKGGDILLQGQRNITTGDLLSTANDGNSGKILIATTNGSINTILGLLDSSSVAGNGGNIFVNAPSGNVLTGDLIASTTSTSPTSIAGDVTVIAKTQINAGQIVTSAAAGKGGNVLVDPISDVVIEAIDTSGNIQGGNVQIVSTGGNIRLTGFVNSSLASCAGASICTSGGTGGAIAINHGGLNPFIVGDAAINGSAGIISNGLSNLSLGQIIFNFPDTFRLGNISISPGGVQLAKSPVTLIPIPNSLFTASPSILAIVTVDGTAILQSLIIKNEVYSNEQNALALEQRTQASASLKSGNVETAISQIESSYASELQAFIGNPITDTPNNRDSPTNISTVSNTPSTATATASSNSTNNNPANSSTDSTDSTDSTNIPTSTTATANFSSTEPLAATSSSSDASSSDNPSSGEGNRTNNASVNIANVQKELNRVSKLTGSPTAVIYPVMFDDRLELMVILPDGKALHKTVNDSPKKLLLPVIQEFRANLTDSGSDDYLVQSKQLHAWLIKPIEEILETAKISTLVFVMDGDLRVIPSAALHDGKSFLIEKYAIASVPSMKLVKLEERDRLNSRVLAMGLTEARAGFSALPAVNTEIGNIVGIDNTPSLLMGKSFINEPFTLQNMQSQRKTQDYGIIHLATHAKFLSNSAYGTFIQLYSDRLYISDIPSLSFNKPQVEMLTLSACETAVGNNLGLAGLAVTSGVRSVLASLWTVSDLGTVPLMLSFYSRFPTSNSKAIALQQAQLSIIRGEVLIEDNKIVGIPTLPSINLPADTSVNIKHPFFWSSFVLVGSWL